MSKHIPSLLPPTRSQAHYQLEVAYYMCKGWGYSYGWRSHVALRYHRVLQALGL